MFLCGPLRYRRRGLRRYLFGDNLPQFDSAGFGRQCCRNRQGLGSKLLRDQLRCAGQWHAPPRQRGCNMLHHLLPATNRQRRSSVLMAPCSSPCSAQRLVQDAQCLPSSFLMRTSSSAMAASSHRRSRSTFAGSCKALGPRTRTVQIIASIVLRGVEHEPFADGAVSIAAMLIILPRPPAAYAGGRDGGAAACP